MTEFEILGSLPAIFLPNHDLIVVSDLHLGLEASMTSRGNYVPVFHLKDVKEEILELKELSDAERILVNGDLKNEYSTSYSEKREVEEFLDFLKENFEDTIIIKGNHDLFLENILEEKGLRLLENYLEDGVLFAHGHKEIEKEDFETLVIGHEHPALSLKDDIGVVEKIPCLLHGETSIGELFVLPPYSKISNGTGVNKASSKDLLSPILKKIDLDRLQAYAISREGGVYNFGILQDL